MRNKVLIIGANLSEQVQFEQILHEIVEEGGELFFAERREDGLFILKREHPQIVFLDPQLIGNKEEWVHEGVHIVLKDRPSPKVLEKCRSFLKRGRPSPIPPM